MPNMAVRALASLCMSELGLKSAYGYGDAILDGPLVQDRNSELLITRISRNRSQESAQVHHEPGSHCRQCSRGPQLRYTPSGIAVSRLRVEVHSRIRSEVGAYQDELNGFLQVVAWRRLAENPVMTLHRQPGGCHSKLSRRSWETEQGSNRSVEITADELAPSLRFAAAEIAKLTGSAPDEQSTVTTKMQLLSHRLSPT